MAIIWSHTQDDRHYEVRSAGRTRRLYTNGTFHSQYNPALPVTGSVWDLLFLPAMFAPPGSIKRVLVLGVGGGAVINLLNRFIAPEAVVGVELDPIHIKIAREHFGVNEENTTLICEDAQAWIQGYKGEPFDLIIDDLFADDRDEAYRSIEADAPWFERQLKHLTPEGTLVFNFGDVDELESCGYFNNKDLAHKFYATFRLTTKLYDNEIGAFHRRYHQLSELEQRLESIQALDQRRSSCRLSFEIEPLVLPL